MTEGARRRRIDEALARLRVELRRALPAVAPRAGEWLDGAPDGAGVAERIRHPRFLPVFELPRWVERSLRGRIDARLQRDLLWSTLNGYLFVRLVDDAVDRHDPRSRDALPAAAFFHSEFERPLHARFPGGHPFWRVFRDTWFASHDAAAREASLEKIDRESFEAVSARKLLAAKIPVAAVCHVRGAARKFGRWSRFCDRLAIFHQLADDLSDWRQDLEEGRGSFLLSESARRRRRGESVAEWVCRAGFAWAVAELRVESEKLARAAAALDSGDAERYVLRRTDELARWVARTSPGLRALARLAASRRESG